MTNIQELDDLVIELIKKNTDFQRAKFTGRGYEIIDEISDYAEHTRIFQENKEKEEMFDDCSAELLFAYMLDRVANAPTRLHATASVLLIMPLLRKKLTEENIK